MDAVTTELNEEAEEIKKMEKDKRKERKERKEVSDKTDLQCTQPGCTFTTQNKAGLVNQRQKKWSSSPRDPLLLS